MEPVPSSEPGVRQHLRSGLVAAGAGVIGMPLWSVLDIAMVDTVRELLAASRTALHRGSGVFDPVVALHRRYRRLAAESTDPDVLIEQLPISLYL